jgi:ribosomal protein S18 acetylase RimI-like enzyme
MIELIYPFARDATNMEANLKIQIASEADLGSLVYLAAAFRDHLKQSTPADADFRESFTILLKDAGTEFFLACDTRGASLGYVQCRYRYSAWTSSVEAELEDVFVVRAARRGGVGRRLVEFAIARATARGCRSIGLNTNEGNESAIALYRQLGFLYERPLWKGGRQLWLDKSLENEPAQSSALGLIQHP